MAKKIDKESSDGVFIFDTKLLGYRKEVTRTIAIPKEQSLYKLAEAIIAAYNFDFDHCFGFFDSKSDNPYSKSVRKYELFTDMVAEGMNIEPTGADSVKHTRLDQVWSRHGDSMLFLFDYGDVWRFLVTLTATGNGHTSSSLPSVLMSSGKAPKQYR
ncbi:MAG: hypothetical protein NTY93_01510 [Candidatus Kaiserbacteria bacterium]|nr:hypothetical protein [Candidatus Kaiserbacteria bacterium]